MRRVMQSVMFIIFVSLIILTITVFLSLYMSIFNKKYDKFPPTIPSELKSTGDTPDTIDLIWNQSKDEKGGSGLKEYVIYSAKKDDDLIEVGRTEIGEYSSVQYTIENLNATITYAIKVSSIDNAGNESSLSKEIYATTDPWHDGDKPTPPSNISLLEDKEHSIGEDWVELKWDPGEDETSGIWKYEVFKNYSSTSLGKTDGDECHIRLEELKHNTSYSINIMSYDKAWPTDPVGHESDLSSSFSFRTK